MRRFFFLFVRSSRAIVAGGGRIANSYAETRELYRKDFLQEYVLARAVLDGSYPYAPMPEMTARFDLPPSVPWSHPTPHTPAAAILSSADGAVSPSGRRHHLGSPSSLACLAIVVELLARAWGEPVPLLMKVAIFLMSLATGPVLHELWFGQFGAILLLLLTLAWLKPPFGSRRARRRPARPVDRRSS